MELKVGYPHMSVRAVAAGGELFFLGNLSRKGQDLEPSPLLHLIGSHSLLARPDYVLGILHMFPEHMVAQIVDHAVGTPRQPDPCTGRRGKTLHIHSSSQRKQLASTFPGLSISQLPREVVLFSKD